MFIPFSTLLFHPRCYFSRYPTISISFRSLCRVGEAKKEGSSLGIYVPAFLQVRATLNIDIEQVNLLVPLSDIPILVNPYQRILHFLLSSLNLRWLMHADVDRQL